MRSTWIYLIVYISVNLGPCKTIMNSEKVIRRDGVEKIFSKLNREMELIPMISCVKSVIEKGFVGKSRVPVMVPSFVDISGLSEPFFSVLEEKVVVFSVTENFSTSENYFKSHNAIVLVKNSTDFELLDNLIELCAPRCRYVICLLTIYEDVKSFLEEADAMVKVAWKDWIMKTVVVGSAGGKLLVAGTRSFESNTSKVLRRPEVLGECGAFESHSYDEYFGTILMNNSIVNVTLFDCPPYAFLKNENTIGGIEGEIFEAIAESLDISLNRLNISLEKDVNDSQYDMLIDVLENPEESDAVFCGLYWDISNTVEYSIPYEMEKVVWLVPSTQTLTLLGLVTPLHTFVWLGIIGLLVSTGLMKVLFFKKISFLGVMGLILGIALPRQPRTLSNRIQFASLVFFGYVITQSYLASLAGQLMNTNYETIKNMMELESSGMKFGGTARHRNLFKIDEDSISHRIYEKYQTLSVSEYEETLAALKAKENLSIALVTELKISHFQSHPEPYDPHTLKEVLAGYPVAFAVWKGLPYLDQINAKISALTESGLVKHWSLNYGNISSSKFEISRSNQLRLLQLSPSFLLLLLGHAFGLIVFLIEIGIYAKRTNRFTKKRSEGKKNKSK